MHYQKFNYNKYNFQSTNSAVISVINPAKDMPAENVCKFLSKTLKIPP